MTEPDETRTNGGDDGDRLEVAKETLEDLDTEEDTADAIKGGGSRYVNTVPQPCYDK